MKLVDSKSAVELVVVAEKEGSVPVLAADVVVDSWVLPCKMEY